MRTMRHSIEHCKEDKEKLCWWFFIRWPSIPSICFCLFPKTMVFLCWSIWQLQSIVAAFLGVRRFGARAPCSSESGTSARALRCILAGNTKGIRPFIAVPLHFMRLGCMCPRTETASWIVMARVKLITTVKRVASLWFLLRSPPSLSSLLDVAETSANEHEIRTRLVFDHLSSSGSGLASFSVDLLCMVVDFVQIVCFHDHQI